MGKPATLVTLELFRELVNYWRFSANRMPHPPLVRHAWYSAADDLCELLNHLESSPSSTEIPDGLCERSDNKPFRG